VPALPAALRRLLAALEPALHDGEFAFTAVPPAADLRGLDVVATIREPEGLSVVLPAAQAAARGHAIAFRAAWITLRVDSDLAAVGLTAAVAGALADDGIACNVVAGTAHDHLFVPFARRDDALRVLRALQREAAR
jgi:hypothetical protein